MITKHVTAAVLTLAAASITGCNRDESQARDAALWLCRYSQVPKPIIETYPPDAKPEDHVAPEDLSYLKAHNDDAGALGAALMATIGPAASAINEALAEQVKCEVSSIKVEGKNATVTLKSSRPKLENSGMEAFDRLGELAKLDSRAARVAKAKEWFANAKGTETAEDSISLVKGANGWLASYELQKHAAEKKLAEEKAAAEARAAAAREEVAELLKKKAANDGAMASLAKFEVTKARFRMVRREFIGPQPVIDLSVTNGTTQPVSRAYFRGTLASPGRSIPWLRESFNYQIPGGLEPNESANWSLEPNMFSEWGKVSGPSDMVLTIEVLRIDGADGAPLFARTFDDDDQKRLDSLQATLGTP